MSVTFKSIDKKARTATFDVSGESVTRRIPAQFEGTIDDYLNALAKGLHVEDQSTVEDKTIETPTMKEDEVVIADEVKE